MCLGSNNTPKEKIRVIRVRLPLLFPTSLFPDKPVDQSATAVVADFSGIVFPTAAQGVPWECSSYV